MVLKIAFFLLFGIILGPVVMAQEPGGSEFVESFVIILREGLEAILVIGAIIAYLVSTKNHDKTKIVYMGVVIAIAASVVTAYLLDQVFIATNAQLEILEGVTMLLAAAVLLYVTNWLLGKMDSARWTKYIKGKVDSALTAGSAFALGAASFLAVYREGFETVLFFKALAIGSANTSDIFFGLALGLAVLAVLFFLIIKIETRLPLNIVFGVSSAILFLLSLKFAGKGVHELQEAGVIPGTAWAIVPKIKDLGIYPTVETLGIQIAIIILGTVLLMHYKPGKEK